MHDLFGAEMMDVFDLDNGDVDLRILEPPKKKPQEQQTAPENSNQQQKTAKAASDGSVKAKGEGENAQLPTENFDTKKHG